MVKDLRAGLQAQKAAADEKHQEESDKCQEDTNRMITGINEANADITKYEGSLALDRPVLETR